MKVYLVAGITQDNYITDDSSHIEYGDADKRISELEEECNGTQWEIISIDVPQRDSCYVVNIWTVPTNDAFNNKLLSQKYFTPLIYFDKNKAKEKCDQLNREIGECGYIFVVEDGSVVNI